MSYSSRPLRPSFRCFRMVVGSAPGCNPTHPADKLSLVLCVRSQLRCEGVGNDHDVGRPGRGTLCEEGTDVTIRKLHLQMPIVKQCSCIG